MITIRKHSGIYTLELKQELPVSIEEAWEFFSNPANLAKITPGHMGFRITSGDHVTMYPGQIISYRVSPFPGFSTNWVTEITHVESMKYFVDEQRFGPYRMWHHEHRFEKSNGGIIMTDKVTYKLPFAVLGHLAYFLFVRKQLRRIFEYRYQMLSLFFNP
ncbi:MAG: SRPBCC family protein [Mangrovibacterium sp.]